MRNNAPERIPSAIDVDASAPEAAHLIVAADVPRHSDHLAVALVVSLMIALTGAFAIVMVPRPANEVRYLEQARTIRTRALEERDRRRALKPLRVAARPRGDQLTWSPGASLELSMRAQESRAHAAASTCEPPQAFDALDALGDEALIEAPLSREGMAIDEAFDDDALLVSVNMPYEAVPPQALASSRGTARVPTFACRYPSREAVRVWFEEHVRPVLSECMFEDMPAFQVQGAVTLAFDDVGRVASADLGATMSDGFAACAQPGLTSLAMPDAYELTFTWPFILVP